MGERRTSAGTSEIEVLASAGWNSASFAGVLNGKEAVEVSGDSAAGVETDSLWLTDGTAAGTGQVASFTGTTTSYPNLTVEGVYNNNILFTVNDLQGNLDLWTSDGTAAEYRSNGARFDGR